MAVIVSEFFGIIGVDMLPPQNMAELIPYLLQVIVGVVLVLAVFGVIKAMASMFVNRRWFR